jgi:hypothetical protein
MKKMHLVLLAAVLVGVVPTYAMDGWQEGKVVEINHNTRRIVLALRDGSSGHWSVLPNAKVSVGTEAVEFSDVEAGFVVKAWVKTTGEITGMQIVESPAGFKFHPIGGRPPAGGHVKACPRCSSGISCCSPKFCSGDRCCLKKKGVIQCEIL